ncbi:MAG TPA: Rrf2 family transcriptional regulator [Chitinophagaceae bacterium]
MLSKTCEYGIRASIFIAQATKEGNRVSIPEIAAGIDAPEQFIAKILHNLTRQGLLQSMKGPTGGFFFNEKSLKQSLADIVIAIDGDKLFTGCGLGLDYCSEKKPCPIHHQFKKIREECFDMLHSAKLGAIRDELEHKVAFLKQR